MFQSLGFDQLAGKKILVHAGGGGVGSFAIAYCKNLGMTVATTVSAAKADLATQLGADIVIDYKTQVGGLLA